MNPLNVNLFVKLQKLARILYNAAVFGSYVDPDKVEEILGYPPAMMLTKTSLTNRNYISHQTHVDIRSAAGHQPHLNIFCPAVGQCII